MLPTLPNLPPMPPTIARYCTLEGGKLFVQTSNLKATAVTTVCLLMDESPNPMKDAEQSAGYDAATHDCDLL
jgi:hypothetical protein